MLIVFLFASFPEIRVTAAAHSTNDPTHIILISCGTLKYESNQFLCTSVNADTWCDNFFSSLVALQRHNTDEATTGGNKNELQARGNLARISSISKEYINASVTAGLKNVAKFNIFAAHRSAEDMGFMSLPHHIPDVVSEENTTPPAKKTESKISASAMHNVTNTQGISCIPSFESICEMYSYVRFWKKRFNRMDCHQSPARHPLGMLQNLAIR